MKLWHGESDRFEDDLESILFMLPGFAPHMFGSEISTEE
jgi:hypothetical protein